jgi:hypothetical protein
MDGCGGPIAVVEGVVPASQETGLACAGVGSAGKLAVTADDQPADNSQAVLLVGEHAGDVRPGHCSPSSAVP